MAVPNTNTFSLEDVRVELGLGATTSLSACFSSADPSGFDAAYSGSKDRLSNFRNYKVSGLELIYSNSTFTANTVPPYGGQTTMNVVSGSTLAVLIISAYTSIGTVTVSDSTSATWTQYGSATSNQVVFYTSNLSTLGNRTISYTNTGSAYHSCAIVAFKNSASAPVGSIVSSFTSVSGTITVPYTSQAGTSIILSAFYSSRGGSVGDASQLAFITYGTNQVAVTSNSSDGVGGPPDTYLVITQEASTSSTSNNQIATNIVTNDNKRAITFSIK